MSKTVQLTIEIELCKEDELSPIDLQLIQKARAASANAYAPYSNFWVGAAILLQNGDIIQGNNQENAAYPSGICAERSAIYWIGANYPKEEIKTIAVTARQANAVDFLPVTPCGACRQAILEYEEKQENPIKMLLEGNDGYIRIIKSAGDLLPLKFTEGSLVGQSTENV